MFTGILDGAPPKPTRGQINHYYSRKFYDTRVKERADARIAALKRRAQLAGEPEPKPIDVISKVTKEVWEEETPEFRKECELAMEREYAESLKAWEQSLADSPTRTPEEISAYVVWAYVGAEELTSAIERWITRHIICSPLWTPSSSGLECARRCCYADRWGSEEVGLWCRGKKQALIIGVADRRLR